MAVVPERAGLLGQRKLRNPFGKFRIREIAIVDLGISIRLANEALAVEAVCNAGSLGHQVEDGERALERRQLKNLLAIFGLLLDPYFGVGERRNVFGDGVVEIQFAP